MTVAWANGRLSPVEEPAVRPDDRALFGIGVFEALVCREGRVFALERHLRRLARSAEGIGLSLDDDEVRAGVRGVLSARESKAMARGMMRVTVTGGPAGGVPGGPSGPPTTLVTLAAAAPWPATARVWVCPWARNNRGALTGLKTTSYAENGIALRHAHEHGADEALFANSDGMLCEGAGSNVFVVVGDRLATPPLASGCLAGVTRELLLEWLPGIAEIDLEPGVLETTPEVFLTATSRDVHPVEAVDGSPVGSAPGPHTVRAMAVFAERSPAEWSAPADG